MLDGAKVSEELNEPGMGHVPETVEDSEADDVQHMSLDEVFARPDEAEDADISPHAAPFGYDVTASGPRPAMSRSGRKQRRKEKKQRRRGRLIVTLAAVLIAAGGAGGWYWLRPLISNTFGVADYSGAGSGDVTIHIDRGDTASAIAATLYKAGVVRSEEAFIDAADDNADSKSIAPGSYRLHKEMKASLVITALLDPKTKVSVLVTVPEGETLRQIAVKLASSLGLNANDIVAAATPAAAGLPDSYNAPGATVTSLEGFLFPDTYSYDFGTAATATLNPMVEEFVSTDRSLGFSAGAAAVGLTPYQALIVASMVEGEAKFDEDRPKVARVILNRLAAHEFLGIDATSVYGAIISGRDPKQLTYNENDPYNTRNHRGLPPTPIGNPGEKSMDAVIHPADGNWTHYVNGDAQGHLTFTDEAGFADAVAQCRENHWGCD